MTRLIKSIALIALAIACAVFVAPASAQPVTPEEAALVQTIKAEVEGIDAELRSITENQDALRRSPAMRQDEYESLVARYPGIKITPGSTVEQMYSALYAYRRQRAAIALPIARRQKQEADTRLCKAIADLRESFERLAATDDYKRLPLSDRLPLRASLDDLIATAKSNGTVCPGAAN